jgi:acetylornithine deacetylase/succinyl-diaminopimelate desuccinylase-like protein
MTPEDVEAKVTAHLQTQFDALRSPNALKVSMLHGAKAWLSDISSPNYVAAAKAIKAVFGEEPDYTVRHCAAELPAGRDRES